MLNIIRQRMGIIRQRKYGVKVTLSIMQKRRNTKNVKPKLISADIFFENRKRYFGTFILVKISALEIRADIPPLVASLKKVNIIFPQNR
jgi:hypothetical protein